MVDRWGEKRGKRIRVATSARFIVIDSMMGQWIWAERTERWGQRETRFRKRFIGITIRKRVQIIILPVWNTSGRTSVFSFQDTEKFHGDGINQIVRARWNCCHSMKLVKRIIYVFSTRVYYRIALFQTLSQWNGRMDVTLVSCICITNESSLNQHSSQ